jgi:hypothetical protein
MTGRGLFGAYVFVRTVMVTALLIPLKIREPALIVLAVVVLVGWAAIELSRRLEPRTGGSAWWAGVLIPIGLGVWASFLYIGARARRAHWVVWAAVYLSMIVLAGTLNSLGNDEDPTLTGIASFLYLGAWAGGALHAYVIRAQVRRALSAAAT